MLNDRFLRGVPSNNVRLAGVFVHQNDAESNWEGWGTHENGYGDRMAGSVVNVQMPYTFSTSAIGYVLRPTQVAGAIRCSYALDGNSMGSYNGGCSGGGRDSGFDGEAGLEAMMQQSATHRDSWCPAGCGCAWGVTEEDRNGCRYNEIVFDGNLWAARLPHFIEAIFLPINGEVKTWEGGSRDFARDVRDRFVRTYGLSAQSVPVVTYDLEAAENGLAPFEQIRV